MKETILIPQIGNIALVSSKRAKNLRISIKPLEGVKVTKPYRMSKRKALSFVMQKQDWILKHLDRIDDLKKNYTVFDQHTAFNTFNHHLKIEAWENERFYSKIKNGIILFKYPKQQDVTSPDIQKRVRLLIEKTWKNEAEEILIPRLFEIASAHNFNFNKIAIKNVKSKWGSCSYYNDIILSLHIMRLPAHLQDYIILHELCHTIEKNHQAPFWNLMNTVTYNKAKILDKELKQYSTKIY